MYALARHHHRFGCRFGEATGLVSENTGCVDDRARGNREAFAGLSVQCDYAADKTVIILVSSVTPQ